MSARPVRVLECRSARGTGGGLVTAAVLLAAGRRVEHDPSLAARMRALHPIYELLVDDRRTIGTPADSDWGVACGKD